jgi:hypothetical protein
VKPVIDQYLVAQNDVGEQVEQGFDIDHGLRQGARRLCGLGERGNAPVILGVDSVGQQFTDGLQ